MANPLTELGDVVVLLNTAGSLAGTNFFVSLLLLPPHA